MATGSRFLLRPGLVIVQPAVGPALAMADSVAVFLRRVREMDSRRAVVAAAVSFAARFWPVADLAVVVAFDLCRCPTRFATAGFVLAADPADSADFDFASSDFCFAEASERGRVVAVPFCSLVHQSSF